MDPFVLPPAGLTPAATWEPLEVIVQKQAVALLPRVDGATGEIVSLSDTTGQLDPPNRTRLAQSSHDPTYQAIAAEFRTTFGSGVAVTNFGNKFSGILKNDESATTNLPYEVDRILAPYLDKRLIRVDSIDIKAGPAYGSRASITVQFTVLKANEQYVVSA